MTARARSGAGWPRSGEHARIGAIALVVCGWLAGACSYDLGPLGPEPLPDAAPPVECDEVAQTGCQADSRCTVCASKVMHTRACVAKGTKAAGEACAAAADCAAGTVCWNADTGSTFVCRRFCKVAGDCPAAQPMCKAFTDYACPQVPGQMATFGLCY